MARPGPKKLTDKEKRDARETATRATLIHHAQTANGATRRKAVKELDKRSR